MRIKCPAFIRNLSKIVTIVTMICLCSYVKAATTFRNMIKGQNILNCGFPCIDVGHIGTYWHRYYDLDPASQRVAVVPLQLYCGTNTRVRRITIFLISLALIGFLVPPHTCRGATLPMPDLGPNIFTETLKYNFIQRLPLPLHLIIRE